MKFSEHEAIRIGIGHMLKRVMEAEAGTDINIYWS